MGDDSLLDQLIADTEQREREAPVQARAAKAMASELDAARRQSRLAQRKAEMEQAEKRTRRRVAGSVPELGGLKPGDRFELRKARPELAGTWVVERVEPGAAGDASRRLYAARPDGRPGYLPLTENQVRDLRYSGALRALD